MRPKLRSPGHPKFQRHVEAAFWAEIAKGLLPIEAAAVAGVMLATVATVWHLAFTYAFEAWERRQRDRTRTLRRRLLHALSFQTTLVCLLVPLIAWWLEISPAQALLLDLVFIIYVPFYTFAYNWAFDRIFGVPDSAVNEEPAVTG